MSDLTCADHNDRQELDYVAWHEWARKRDKTHRQVKCPECGLFSIWIKRKTDDE